MGEKETYFLTALEVKLILIHCYVKIAVINYKGVCIRYAVVVNYCYFYFKYCKEKESPKNIYEEETDDFF